MRRVLVAGGALLMGCGLVGAATDSDVNVVGAVIFLAAVLVLHDGVFLPVVLGAGGVVHRLVPRRWRAPAQAAGFLTLAVSVVALPLVTGFGKNPGNPSILPGSYGAGLFGILALVWVAVLSATALRSAARRRESSAPPGSPSTVE